MIWWDLEWRKCNTGYSHDLRDMAALGRFNSSVLQRSSHNMDGLVMCEGI